MYEAMVAKDTVTLNRVHADDFVLMLLWRKLQPTVLYCHPYVGFRIKSVCSSFP